jgi:hypothetical protein
MWEELRIQSSKGYERETEKTLYRRGELPKLQDSRHTPLVG